MAPRNQMPMSRQGRARGLRFAVTGTLLALVPVTPESCQSAAHPDLSDGPAAPTDRLSNGEPGPVVNPGPTPSRD